MYFANKKAGLKGVVKGVVNAYLYKLHWTLSHKKKLPTKEISEAETYLLGKKSKVNIWQAFFSNALDDCKQQE